MPTAVLEQTSPAEAPRKRWTRAECAAVEATGVWDQQHIELINGELISKMGKKRLHTVTMTLVHTWLGRVFGPHYVNSETPIDVAAKDNLINEPEPDLIVLSRPSHEILTGNVQPSDLRLVVEISDSTLGFDLKVKAPLYARAGIPEYWVVDISGRRIIVHRDPREGAYGSIEAYSEQEAVRPLAAPEQAFPVSSAFLA